MVPSGEGEKGDKGDKGGMGPGSARVRVQVVRGIAWSALIVVAAAIVAWVDPIDRGAVHGKRLAVVVGVTLGGLLAYLLVRRWNTRPRWFLPLAIGVLAASAWPAFWAFPNPDSAGVTCSAMADAWLPVVKTPSATDQALVAREYTVPASIADAPLAEKRAWFESLQLLQISPAVQRVQRWETWGAGQGPCAPRARRQLAASAVVLVVGAIGLGVAVESAKHQRQSRTTNEEALTS